MDTVNSAVEENVYTSEKFDEEVETEDEEGAIKPTADVLVGSEWCSALETMMPDGGLACLDPNATSIIPCEKAEMSTYLGMSHPQDWLLL
jgi:hypothetical protein